MMNFDDLSKDERLVLAYCAYVKVTEQEDVRYWHGDPAIRAERKERWKVIQDALAPDLWSSNVQDR